ncbi:MAG: C-GCAxxG-C-C family (seleno)protein [Chloroflexota bacterium]
MADEKRDDANSVSRRRFLAGATAAAGLVTTASGLTLLGGASSAAAAAQTEPASSVTVSVPFGSFAAYSFPNNVANRKIGITMTYSPTDPKDAGQANAKAVVLDVYAPGVAAAAGKPSGVASGPAGNQYFQVESPANGEYVLVVRNWDSMKRTVSVTLKASYVGGAAIALIGVSGAAAAAAAPASSGKIAWPFPYKKLDPEIVRKEGHKAYYAAGCMYGAFHAIISQLQKEVGAPYTGIPTEMMKYGEGGGVSWGTLCGALNGSAAAINLVLPDEGWRPIVNELFGWYTTELFPSDISNRYAEEGKFLVEKMKYDKALPQNVSGSPLCHASVTEWCQVANVNVADPKRAERCGRLTGDVAAQAVIMLNDYAEKSFKAAFKADDKTAGCVTCHNPKADANAGGIVNTKMACAPCHPTPHTAKKP